MRLRFEQLAVIGTLGLAACSGGITISGFGSGKKASPAKPAESAPAASSSSSDASAPVAGNAGAATAPTAGSAPASSGAAPAAAAGGGPSWCGGYQPSSSDSNASWVKSYIEREGVNSLKTVQYMARAACDKPTDGARQQDVASWRQMYKATFGASDADFERAMKLYVMDNGSFDNLKKEQCGTLEKPGRDAPASERLAYQIASRAMQCDSRGIGEDVMWWLDRATISELERWALVDRCVSGIDMNREYEERGSFAFCGPDMAKLGRAKLDKEMSGMKLNLYGQVNLAESYGATKVIADWVLAQQAKLAAKDADWKRLYAAPEVGYRAWSKAHDGNRDIFSTVKDFNGKLALGSKKAMAGCGAKLRPLYLAHVKSSKPSSPEEFAAAAMDDAGYPLMVAMMACDVAEGRFLEAATAHGLFFTSNTNHRHGPRHAAYYTTLTVLNDIRADREKFPLDRLGWLPSTGSKIVDEIYSSTYNKINYDKATGQIAKVKAHGDSVTVTFKTVKWKEPTYKCRRTHRISRIDNNGNLIYEEKCKVTGSKKMSSTENPVEVPADFAGGLAPGQMVVMSLDSKGGQRHAIPTAVYADKDKKKLIGAFGIVW